MFRNNKYSSLNFSYTNPYLNLAGSTEFRYGETQKVLNFIRNSNLSKYLSEETIPSISIKSHTPHRYKSEDGKWKSQAQL